VCKGDARKVGFVQAAFCPVGGPAIGAERCVEFVVGGGEWFKPAELASGGGIWVREGGWKGARPRFPMEKRAVISGAMVWRKRIDRSGRTK